jgi:hypothetical protein
LGAATLGYLPSPSPSSFAETSELSSRADVFAGVVTFVVWLVLLVLCWPLALLALILYPIVWTALIPFRLVGIAVDGVLELVRSIVMLPARLLRRPSSRKPSSATGHNPVKEM